MKNRILFFLSLVLVAFVLTTKATAQALYVGSYNIRYQNSGDTRNGNAWEKRCPVVCGQLNFEHPDIFGTQEVLDGQLHDMLDGLDGYSYIGVGRDDGKKEGEYAAIFYDEKKLKVEDSGYFWLSETPDKPSKGWDAACNRICTWGLFQDQTTGLKFYFYNLHMDHVGVKARRESAKLVMDHIRKMAGEGIPYVLTGDFNADQHDEVYGLFTQSGLLRDSYTHTRLRFAENGTFNNYHQERKTDSRIDHILVSPHFSVERYAILTNTYWDDTRRLPSDHYPVFVHLKIQNAETSAYTPLTADGRLRPYSPPVKTQLCAQVNPFIGTGGHGHATLSANVPFGFVQLGPTQRTSGWDWCSGYNYGDSTIIGFGHLHLSGTGVGDLGDIALLPVTKKNQNEVTYSHQAETVQPGYYGVLLNNGVRVELTATERTGLHRYTFPAATQTGYLRLDLKQGVGWDQTTEYQIRQESSTVFSGYRFSKGWANRQKVFFVMEFSQPVEVCKGEDSMVQVLSFSPNRQPMLVKVGLSAVSIEGAKANLRAEQEGWDFQKVVMAADRKWDAQLSKVKVTGGTADQRTIFYTALYHTMVAPSIFCDVDGKYRGSDGEVHQGNHTNYTTFSLWDTYRAAHPLITLLHPERQEDIAATMLNIWREQGKLPVWHLMGCETNCMVGNPAIPVLADLVLKGLTTRSEEALEAMKASALLDERGLKELKQYGYIPYDKFSDNESVGRGLEYALADWCVARVAEQLGRKDDMKLFDQRAQSYRQYFDKETLFMRGKDSKGHFRKHFNPFHSAPKNRDYTEGNAWQFTWLVPHDVHGLVSLFGTKGNAEQRFARKLDSLFIVEGDLGADAPPDITGLIGQYAHGNEPSHHVLYLFNYIGQPWKGAKLIHQTMNELYHNAPDGLSGNEDVGQMSAWYILSAMGFYQVEPAGGKYIFGTPLFPELTLQLKDNKTFTIKAKDVSNENIYIQHITLNGKPYTRSYILYDDIVKGGTLELQMGPQPSDFGTRKGERP